MARFILRTRPARPLVTVLACVAASSTLLAACSSGGTRDPHSASSPATAAHDRSSSPAAEAAVITLTPGGAGPVNPTAPVSLHVAHGRLTSVVMTNPTGKHVTGATSADGSSWHTTEVLGYGKTYTIDARAVDPDGRTTATTKHLATLSPPATTNATLDRMGGYALSSGATYGVAIVPVVHFDTPITDEAAAQRALKVTTSRSVDGAWSWIDNQDVAYRPESYWPAGTKVTVNAKVYGVEVGKGLYGASDESAHFTVGRRQVTVADDNSPRVDKIRVRNASGRILRTMNTSMGKHGGETVDGQYINFYTLAGTYTVLEHDNPAIMSSQSYGLPADAPNGYPPLKVPYSTKISTDGIYLHEYNSTIYDQNHGNDVSEGCLNLDTADAVWFYNHSLIGDPVVVHGATGAPTIQPDEGGYWSVPWSKWLAGSALH